MTALNRSPASADVLRISGLPFSSKSFIREICRAEKKFENTHYVGKSFCDRTMLEALPSASYIFFYNGWHPVIFWATRYYESDELNFFQRGARVEELSSKNCV